MNQARLARNYAEALFSLARDEGRLQRARDGLQAAQRALEAHPEAWPLLDNPEIPRRAKRAVIEALLSDAWEPLRRLVALLVARQRRALLAEVAACFEEAYQRQAGVTPVQVTAALEPTPAQVARLRQILERRTGGRIELAVHVDPAVLAGMTIMMRDRVIDGTARGTLDRLRAHLAELELRSA